MQIAWVNRLRLVGVVANYITVADVGRPSVAVGERDVVLASEGIALGRCQRSPRTPEIGRGKGSEVSSRSALRLDDHEVLGGRPLNRVNLHGLEQVVRGVGHDDRRVGEGSREAADGHGRPVDGAVVIRVKQIGVRAVADHRSVERVSLVERLWRRPAIRIGGIGRGQILGTPLEC